MAHSSARPRSASLLQHVLKGKEVKPVLVGAVTGIGITAGLSALWLVPRLPDAAPSPGMQSAWDRTEEEDEVEEALSDECAEAAPWLRHPEQGAVVTLVAGGLSGALAKTAVAPLARLTILYQVQALQTVGSQAPSLVAAWTQVVRQEGFRSLWKGNLATILHRFPYAAVNFGTFEWAKKRLQEHTSNDVARRLVAGGLAGLVACTAAYPLDLIRTRIAAQRDMLPQITRLTENVAYTIGVSPDTTRPTPITKASKQHLAPRSNYRGIMHAFRCILREDGPRGLYRGLPATLAQVTPTLALNFCLYDSFRAVWVAQYASDATQPSTSQHSHDSSSSVSGQEKQGLRQSEGVTEEDGVGWATSGQDSTMRGTSMRTTEGQQGPGDSESVASTSGRGTDSDLRAGNVNPPISIAGSLWCASAAGLVTSTATFPLDVVRKRLQTHRGSQAQETYASVCRSIWRQQGMRGFYAGIIPEYLKVLPGMAIAFGTFESIRSAFGVQHTS